MKKAPLYALAAGAVVTALLGTAALSASAPKSAAAKYLAAARAPSRSFCESTRASPRPVRSVME